jgi:hypothetical protein
MKVIAVILFVFASITVKANNPYRVYLLSKILYQPHFANQKLESATTTKTTCVIPHFERPKGAVFCRMEDYLTAKTKVWIKIGVK